MIRPFVSHLVPLALSLALLSPAHAAPGAAHEELNFTVLRNGDTVGQHVIVIDRSRDQTLVKVNTGIVVKVAFVPVYRFEHQGEERWTGEQLAYLASTTNDDGTRHRLLAQAGPAGLAVQGDGKTTEAAKDIVPASLWNPRLVTSQQLLNTLDGSQMAVQVADAGTETVEVRHRPTPAHHYVVTGALQRELWYAGDGTLVKVRFKAKDNSEIVYELR